MAKKHLIDRRLIGYWKSDRARTFRDYVPREGHKPEALKKLKLMFGKLTFRVTERKWSDVTGEKVEAADYEVVAMDSESVVIQKLAVDYFSNDLRPKQRLTQIHFDGPDHFWVWAPMLGDFREFFKRILPPKKTK